MGRNAYRRCVCDEGMAAGLNPWGCLVDMGTMAQRSVMWPGPGDARPGRESPMEGARHV